jgi:hypothetical protein
LLTFDENSARAEPSGAVEQESHGERNSGRDGWDGHKFLLVDQGEPDESLFAREVRLHAHAEPQHIDSFPEDQFLI